MALSAGAKFVRMLNISKGKTRLRFRDSPVPSKEMMGKEHPGRRTLERNTIFSAKEDSTMKKTPCIGCRLGISESKQTVRSKEKGQQGMDFNDDMSA